MLWHYGGRSYESYGDALLNAQLVRSSVASATASRLLNSVVLKAQEEGEGARCAPGAEETAQYGQGLLDLSAAHKSHKRCRVHTILVQSESGVSFHAPLENHNMGRPSVVQSLGLLPVRATCKSQAYTACAGYSGILVLKQSCAIHIC